MQNSNNPKTACIAIDADPLSCYFNRINVKPTEETNLNALYDSSIPRFLDLLDEFNIKATFLIVAKEALYKQNKNIIKELFHRGHEVASHTMTHTRPFANIPKERKKYEIFESKKVLSDIIGSPIVGFRGNDYSVDCETLDLLEEAGYIYDCSNYSSFVAPLINLLDYLSYKGKGASLLVPPPRHGFSPRGPYHPGKKISWLKGNRKILEIPSTAIPLIGLQYSSPIFFNLGMKALKFSCRLLNFTKLPLIHSFQGIDLVDYHKEVKNSKLKVIRGITIPLSKKIDLCKKILGIYKQQYQIITLKELALKY